MTDSQAPNPTAILADLYERLDVAMEKVKRQKSNVRAIREELDALKASLAVKAEPAPISPRPLAETISGETRGIDPALATG